MGPKSDEKSSIHGHGRRRFASLLLLLIFVGGLGSTCMGTILSYLYFYPDEEDQQWLLDVIHSASPVALSITSITLPNFETCVAASACAIVLTLASVLYFHNLLMYLQLNMPHAECKLPYPFGCIIEFLALPPWDAMTAWHREMGSIYSFTLLGRNCVSVANPMYLQTILQRKIRNVKKDVKFAYAPFLSILGRGIVTSEGHSWKDQRLAVSSVLRHDVLDVIPEITLCAVQRLCRDVLDPAVKSGDKVDLSEHLRHLTLQVISKTFFSLSAEESDTTLATMYLPIMEECNKRVWHPERKYAFFLPSFWAHLSNVHTLNSYVSALIEKRWKERQAQTKLNQHDILDRILDVYETKKHVTHSLSKQQIRQLRDEMKTFMLAGHETSASMMTWAFFEVLQPDNKETAHMRKEACIEADRIFDKDLDWGNASSVSVEQLPSRSELDKLEYSLGCLKVSEAIQYMYIQCMFDFS
jgi:cytochrome P450